MTDLNESPAKCPTCTSPTLKWRRIVVKVTNDTYTQYRCADPWHDAAALPESKEMPPNTRDIHSATRLVSVWVDVDEGIADLVEYLNTIPGVRTHTSCQGTLTEGG